MHTRLQLDPSAQLSLRPGRDGTFEILVLDGDCSHSTVIELSPQQLAALCEEASER